jgi:hypothetical protein
LIVVVPHDREAGMRDYSKDYKVEVPDEITALAYTKTLKAAMNVAKRKGANIFLEPDGNEVLTDIRGNRSPSLTRLAVEVGSASAALLILKQYGSPVAAAAWRYAQYIISFYGWGGG